MWCVRIGYRYRFSAYMKFDTLADVIEYLKRNIDIYSVDDVILERISDVT